MGFYAHKDFIREIMQACLKWHKNLFAFDNLSSYAELIQLIQENGNQVYYPEFTSIYLDGNPRGKLRRFGKPVLCIMGTSSKQGKFSLQLTLRHELKKRGYKIGQLGTEPSSQLFGIEEVFPSGYGADKLVVRS